MQATVRPAQQAFQIDPAMIKSLIDSDIYNAQQLEQLLTQEKNALAKRDSKTIKQVVEAKKPLLQSLEKNALSRNQILRAMSLTESPDDWRKLVATMKLEKSWTQLENQLKRCQQLNAVNELVISRSKQSVGHVLNILRGNLGKPNLYNQTGNTNNQNSSGRTITTA